MAVKVVAGNSPKDIQKFIKAQWLFYKDDPNWVPPMIMDRTKLFNKDKNPFFLHSEMEFFLAYRGNDIVGRVAAIKNDNHNTTHNDKIGFFGFFECINDQEVANALFDAAGAWIKYKGLDTMRGPVNPSLNDEVALLVEGFDGPPVCLMSYNPQYYMNLIDGYGFAKAKDMFAYLLDQKKFMSDKMYRMQRIVRERNDVTVKTITFKNKTQLAKDVEVLRDLYNQAWEPNWGFVKMTNEEFDFLVEDFKQIADPEFAFIVYIKGEPAGFTLALPDINQCLIHNKNGSTLGGIWHLLTKRKKINCVRIIVLGIIPKFQKTGVDTVMYYELGERAGHKGITHAEASWILEDNTMMNRGLTQTMNGKLYRKYRVYDKKV